MENNCGVYVSNELAYLSGIIFQSFLLLSISNLLHFPLRRLGQPSAVSQMLAGLILGRSGIASAPVIGTIVFPDGNMDYLSSMASLGRMFYMFLLGLELNVPYLLRITRRSAVVASGGIFMCLLIGGAISPVMYWMTKAYGNRYLFSVTVMLVFTDTASPILVRMVSELKLSTTDFGRMATAVALFNDILCLFLVALLTQTPTSEFSVGQKLGVGIATLMILGCSAYLARIGVRWLNRKNRQRKHIKNSEVVSLVLFIVGVSSLTELMGYNSMLSSFFLGLAFPREGCTTRTLMHRLVYPVQNILLPIYIGYAGVQTSFLVMNRLRFAMSVVAVVVLSTVAKVGGTVAATKYLGMPLQDGVLLGFLLNVKGHIDLIILGLSSKHHILGADALMVFLVTVAMSTLMVGPVAAAVARRERKQLKSKPTGIEHQSPETELVFLACVHSPRDAPSVLNLIEISTGPDRAPVTVYMLQLVELQKKTKTDLLYHQQEDDGQYSDDEDYGGGNHARQINVTVDAFMVDTGIRVRQLKMVSPLAGMDVRTCRMAKDVRANIVIVPFHRFQRVDGKMVGGRDWIKDVNMRIPASVPCTLGVLVDRGLSEMTQITNTQGGFHVAVLFFGGADDRDAAALGGRLALHPSVSLTLMKFVLSEERRSVIKMQASKKTEAYEILVEITEKENEVYKDDAFLTSFYNRFVVTGKVKYEEKIMDDGDDTAASIAAMGGFYSLFLVGKDSRSPLLETPLDEWDDDCPNLGPVGNLLASTSFATTASALVLLQHKKPPEKEEDEEEAAGKNGATHHQNEEED